MPRRLRREFHQLESQLEHGIVDKQWRALIDKVLYEKGDGPEPIRDQLRLRSRLTRLHGRRNRYNQKRSRQRYHALIRKLEPRHIIAGFAIGAGIVEASEGSLPSDLLIGALAGDSRLTRKLLSELETTYEALFPSFHPRDSHSFWMKHSTGLQVVAREERKGFVTTLKPTSVAEHAIAPIPYGFRLSEPLKPDATLAQPQPQTARAAS